MAREESARLREEAEAVSREEVEAEERKMAGIRARALSTKGFLNTQVMVSGRWGAEGRSRSGWHHTQRWGRKLPVAAPILASMGKEFPLLQPASPLISLAPPPPPRPRSCRPWRMVWA